MSFWSSDRAPDEAANILCKIGEGFSKLEETGKLVEELIAFLENLQSTFKSVENPKYDWILRQAVQDNVTAISEPLRKAEVDILKSMGLNEDDLSLTPDMKSSTARIFWRTMYHEKFSAIITKLRDEVAIPLLGLHMSLATMCPHNLPRTKKKLEGWAATSKRFIDKRLMYQANEWLWPVSLVREQYQSYIDNVSFANCEWFFSKQQYIDWYNHLPNKGSPILWISGILGVGRTQIAARVVQKLREKRRMVAYFFLGKATRLDATYRNIMVTLCWELLNQFPEDVDLLPEVRNNDSEPTETEIRDCLLGICERRDAIIVLDGLVLDDLGLDSLLLDNSGLDSPGWVSEEDGESNKLWQFLATLNRVCDVIIFSREDPHVKQSLSDHDPMPHISNCEADFWNEVEKVPTRYAAESKTQDEMTEQRVDAQIGSDEGIRERVIRFPRSREDQCQIIDEADYLFKSTFERHEPLEIIGDKIKRNIPYLLSDPIEGTKHSPIRKIIVTCKHNEVWKEFPGKNDDNESSSKYFDLIVRKANGSVQHIRFDHRLGTIKSSNIRSGDRIGVVPNAITPGLADFSKSSRRSLIMKNVVSTYSESTPRSRGSSISSYYEDADQLEPTTTPTITDKPNEQTPAHHTDRRDGNARSSILVAFVKIIRKLLRPAVRPGYRRLEWTCTCGESLYSDFEEKNLRSLDELAARLKQQSGQGSQHDASGSISQPKKVHTRQGTTVGYKMPGASSSSSSNGQNNIARSVAGSSGLKTVKHPRRTALQLCIETGKYKLEMSELTHPNRTVTDGELFAMIRERYERTRHSILPKWARFKKPNKAIFVQFFLGTRQIVSLVDGTLETPSFPPETEVRHNYDYNPCPMNVRPMDSRVFFHHFYAPETEHPDVFWSERLPWKVGPALRPKDNGWGIHLGESPDWPLFAASMCLLLLLSGVVAGIYAWLMKDAQTGVAIGAWLTSAQVMGITAVFFWSS
ncbi:hypothetical protein AG0111_0g12615 [Alternaria gaisen]|uniref:Uncharacterized protein n=1 Tax=Alternaria gaisen TaxID=167740 RepID=A0ACB6F3S6_9PLEO|nr:hypothetical protein AG0111_0g12615 [Alternaria gaisen]